MTATQRAGAWWLARSRRERWMLVGLGLVLAALVAWYGLLTPLRWAAGEAADRRARAVANLALTEDLAPAPGTLQTALDLAGLQQPVSYTLHAPPRRRYLQACVLRL